MKRALHFFLFLISTHIYAQVKINELQNDAGSNDSKSGEWIELYNTAASSTDISCFRLTNGGNTRITIPFGTVVPANGFLLIGRSSKMSCADCDFENIVQNEFSTKFPGVSGLYVGTTAPYNNSIFLDLDSCNCSSGALAGVWNNANLGDRTVLFNGNVSPTIVDAWQTGGGNNYGTGILTVTAPTTGSSCPSQVLSLPAVGDPIYTTVEARDIVGCNTSYALSVDGVSGTIDNSGNGNGSNGPLGADNPTPGVSNSYSSSPRYKFFKDLVEITPLSSSITVCDDTPIDLLYEIYNYQNVEQDLLSPKGKVGSFYRIDNGTPTAWTHTNVDINGKTTLSTSVVPLLGTHTYEFYWAENDRTCNGICPGTSSYSVVNDASSSTYECYGRRTLNITYVKPATAVSLTCASSVSGMNQVVLTPPDATVASYTLTSTGGYNVTNTTELFQVLDSETGIFTLTVNNVAGCLPASIIVSPVIPCKAPPLCPLLTLNALTSTASGAKCPGDIVDLCVNTPTNANLPNGGTVEWYKGTTSGFDPYLSPSSDMICSKTIAVGTPTCPADGNNLFINEIGIRPATGDGAGGGEYIELFNPGPCSKDISCFLLVHSATSGGGTATGWTVRLPDNLTIPACTYFLIGGVGGSAGTTGGTGFPTSGSTTAYSGGGTAEVDISTITTRTWIRGSLRTINFTNSAGQVSIHDASGTLVQSVSWNNGNNAGTYPAGIKLCDGTSTSTLANPGNSATNVTFNATGDRTILRSSTGTYSASTVQSPDQPNASQTTCISAPVTVPCCNYTIPASDCNVGVGSTQYYKAIVRPIAASCSKPNATTAALNYTVSCISATLSGSGFTCLGGTNPTLIVTGLPNGSTFIVKENGVNVTRTTTTASPYNFTVSNPGTYELISATPSSGCLQTASGVVEITTKTPDFENVYLSCEPTQRPQYQFYSTTNDVGATYTYQVLSVDAGTIPSPSSNTTGIFVFDSVTHAANVKLTVDYGGGSTCERTISFTGLDCAIAGPLPVELVYFKASKQGMDAVLNWITLSELNNDFFEVQHSVDGINFKTIDEVKGNGTSNIRNDYSFIHQYPNEGINYYRLKQVDFDGGFKYSNIEFVNFSEDKTFKLFPNPTHSYLYLTNMPSGDLEISLYDNLGKLVIQKHLLNEFRNNDFSLDIQRLSKGQYFLKISNGIDIISEKILKQ